MHIKVKILVNEMHLVSTPDWDSGMLAELLNFFCCAKEFLTIIALHIQCSDIAVFVSISVYKLQCAISA